jgi:uncharacterized protein (DUF433 family)
MKSNEFITIDSEVMGGRPVFKGTRVPIDGLFEYIEDGLTIDQFADDFPSVSKQMAINVLESLKRELVGS